MYPVELEIRVTTESDTSFFDLHCTLSYREGQSVLQVRSEDFNVHIANFPFMSTNTSTGIYPLFILLISIHIHYHIKPSSDTHGLLLLRLKRKSKRPWVSDDAY